MCNVEKVEFHLSKETRRHLFGLSQQLLWMLDLDPKRSFFLLCGFFSDCSRAIVSADWYNTQSAYISQLESERLRYKKILLQYGLLSDDLPF